MGKKVLLIAFVAALATSISASVDIYTNRHIVVFKQTKADVYRAFTRRLHFLKGSVYPIRLVLFKADSIEQRQLCEYLNIESSMYELELQRGTNIGANYKRVGHEKEMMKEVGSYAGSLGYLPESQTLIFNDGKGVIILEVTK